MLRKPKKLTLKQAFALAAKSRRKFDKLWRDYLRREFKNPTL